MIKLYSVKVSLCLLRSILNKPVIQQQVPYFPCLCAFFHPQRHVLINIFLQHLYGISNVGKAEETGGASCAGPRNHTVTWGASSSKGFVRARSSQRRNVAVSRWKGQGDEF